MIKNLLLDMGGVILDVSYQRVIETFKSYGIENFDKVYTQAKQVEIIDLFEEGKCTAEEFRDGVRKLVGKELSDEQIDKAWFSMILEIPRDVIQLLGV
ncbi:MAG: HAD family phosphatase, partial [Bacteroidales bacterium]|nr:HAD family phosphatase [Bacteroidales bacterium]